MWGAADSAQDGTAEMNTLTVAEGAKRDCNPAVIIGDQWPVTTFFTELQVLTLIIMLKRGAVPTKGSKSGKRDMAIC